MTMRDSISAACVGELQLNTDGNVTQTFCFPASDPTFVGHFPTRPLLPGVFQIEMTRLTAEAALKSALAVVEVTKAKFLRPIVPAENVRLDLKLIEKPEAIQARGSFSVIGQPAGEIILKLTRTS